MDSTDSVTTAYSFEVQGLGVSLKSLSLDLGFNLEIMGAESKPDFTVLYYYYCHIFHYYTVGVCDVGTATRG